MKLVHYSSNSSIAHHTYMYLKEYGDYGMPFLRWTSIYSSYFSPQLKSELFRAHVATLSQKLLPLSTLLFPPPMSLLQIQ